MKFKPTYLALLGIALLATTACSDNNNGTDPDPELMYIRGVVEKGPFEAGGTVKFVALDDKLTPGEEMATVQTLDFGMYNIQMDNKRTLPNYAQITASGKYFDEITGQTSKKAIELEAIVQLRGEYNDTQARTSEKLVYPNVNILTHLEAPRVRELVKGGMAVQQAKIQAVKEVLAAFLISKETDTYAFFERITLQYNTTEANLLAAISAILLNGEEGGSVTADVLIERIREEIRTKGKVSEETASIIAKQSFQLPHETVTSNLRDKYANRGGIILDKIQYFIDGQGRGQVGYAWSFAPQIIMPEDLWKDEQGFALVYSQTIQRYSVTLESYRMVESAYAKTVSREHTMQYHLVDFYDKTLQSTNAMLANTFAVNYQSINYLNNIILGASVAGRDYGKKYARSSELLRAYLYLQNVELWGDAVISEFSAIPSQPSRSSEQEVLDYAITKIEAVYPNLPEETVTLDNLGKDLATALLAKAYMKKKDYNKVLEYTNKLIASDKKELMPDRETNFRSAATYESYLNIPRTSFVTTVGGFFPLVRYAEVLLLNAEANYQIGKKAEAIASLNIVRLRNGKPALKPAEADDEKGTFQQALIAEYSSDLPLESVVFGAMKRLGLAEELLNIESYQLLLPLPLREVDLNPNIKQNPGYDKKE